MIPHDDVSELPVYFQGWVEAQLSRREPTEVGKLIAELSRVRAEYGEMLDHYDRLSEKGRELARLRAEPSDVNWLHSARDRCEATTIRLDRVIDALKEISGDATAQ